MPKSKVYTIIIRRADAEYSEFPNLIAQSYLNEAKAQREFEKLIEEYKSKLDIRFDKEERTKNWWEAYQSGEDTCLFVSIEILVSWLMDESKTAGV